ncbi:MAG: hypothetical protein ACE5HF_03425 [Gemmatimonadota bacterium]
MVKGCLARIGCLTVLALLALAVWWFRDDLSGAWKRLDIGSTGGEVSERLAGGAEAKIGELASSDAPSRLRLSEPEVRSLLRFRIAPLLPAGIQDLDVDLRDSTAVLSARLVTHSLPGSGAVQRLRSFLSDSTRVLTELAARVAHRGEGELEVETLQAGGVVVPSMIVPWILAEIDVAGVKAEGRRLTFAIRPEITSMGVSDGALEFSTAPVIP